MKITASAGDLANALALAASLSNRPKGMLGAVHLVAAGNTLTATTNVLDFAVALTLPATVSAAGEVVVSAERLAALTAAFPRQATLTLARDEDTPVAHVCCGRSRFRLATMPLADLPAVPELAKVIGEVELDREDALTLLRPAFAASTEQSRYYISGVLMHDNEDGLAAVATDGYRLVHVVIPGAAGLSSDHRLNIPAPALKIVGKILASKSGERITLRRSETLFEVSTATVNFVSKLLDGTFPDYKRLLLKPSSNSVIVDHAELMQALERARAAIEHKDPIVGLSWTAAEPVLRLCHRDSDAVDDSVAAADAVGTGRVATRIALLTELLERGFSCKRVRLDNLDAASPILITDPDNTDVLALNTPCAWPAQAHPLDIPPCLRRAPR
jgi:DNA polymerase-3 subunit beta